MNLRFTSTLEQIPVMPRGVILSEIETRYIRAQLPNEDSSGGGQNPAQY